MGGARVCQKLTNMSLIPNRHVHVLNRYVYVSYVYVLYLQACTGHKKRQPLLSTTKKIKKPIDKRPFVWYLIPKMNEMKHWTVRTFNRRTKTYSYSVYSNMTEQEAIDMALSHHPNSVENGAWPYILDICRP